MKFGSIEILLAGETKEERWREGDEMKWERGKLKRIKKKEEKKEAFIDIVGMKYNKKKQSWLIDC